MYKTKRKRKREGKKDVKCAELADMIKRKKNEGS